MKPSYSYVFADDGRAGFIQNAANSQEGREMIKAGLQTALLKTSLMG